MPALTARVPVPGGRQEAGNTRRKASSRATAAILTIFSILPGVPPISIGECGWPTLRPWDPQEAYHPERPTSASDPAREVIGTMKHVLLACLVSALLAASTGCCAPRPWLWHPFGPDSAICEPSSGCGPVATPCAGGCGEACGPVGGTDWGPACGVAEEPCAEPCAGPCGPACYPRGPLSWLFALFAGDFCGDGCGEIYWGDFYSEPPECCDPCDRCGNWTGGPTGQSACPSGGCEIPPPDQYTGSPLSSRYAPRVVSVTDEAVSPTLAETAPAKQASRPRRAPPRQ